MTKTGIVEDTFPDTSETMDSQEEMEEAEMEIDKILFEITAGMALKFFLFFPSFYGFLPT